MKAVCSFCGHRNRADAQVCARCGGSLADARRDRFRIPWASWVPAIPLAALLWFQFDRAERANATQAAEIRQSIAANAAKQQVTLDRLQKEFGEREAQQEEKHRESLKDPAIVSGSLAAARHAEEWQRRHAHDPALAASLLEKTLLEVERLGKDPALTAEAALTKVAELVMPPRSRIEVTPSDGQFVVRVAFRLSAINPEEAGGATRHTSSGELRKEVEDASARIMKDLFDYCGSRGIKRLSVSCNRALLTGQDETERLIMRSVYRGSIDASKAANVASWRQMSVADVLSLMTVEHDVISGIILRRAAKTSLTVDPNEPLEF